MLQKATHELLARDRALLRPPSSRGRIAKRHFSIITSLDAIVTDRHAIDIRRQILQHRLAVTDWSNIDDPLLLPGASWNLVIKSGRTHRVGELRFVDANRSSMRKQKVTRCRQPLSTASCNTTAGHHEVDMRMINHRIASPSVQHSEEADVVAAEELRVG